MRRGLFALVAMFAAWAPVAAWAQSTLTLDATHETPKVEARINGRPVALQVDLRLPRALALSEASAERLRVMRVPFVSANIGVDGGAAMRTRVARPRIVFGDENVRAMAVIAPASVATAADGLIGPGALPNERIVITLGPEQSGARDIVFLLEDPDEWMFDADLGGARVHVSFDIGADATIINRAASRTFDAAGLVHAAGALQERHVILGLSTLMQPVQTDLALEGLPLAPAFARTNAPLLGATEPDAIVVTAEGDGPGPAVVVGRAALAGCSSISVDRRTRRLTLRCV